MTSTTSRTTSIITAEQDGLIDWYYATFVVAPNSGYATMNPAYYQNKYAHRKGPLTREKIAQTLRASAVGQRQRGRPTESGSIAAPLAHPEGWATIAAIDIDYGGIPAVRQALDVCAQYGLWAFAQLSTSDNHDGGHIFIPFDQPLPVALLNDLARRIQATAAVKGEAYPTGKAALRLPLMLHQRAPGGPRRFPLQLADGSQINSPSLWDDLRELHNGWQPNSGEALSRAREALPAVTIDAPQRLHKSQVNVARADGVISWYNRSYPLDDVLPAAGSTGYGSLLHCPWHDDQSPSLAVFQHREGHYVCHCFSRNSNCPAAQVPYLDAFNIYCMLERLDAKEAVRRLAENHGLGRKYKVRTEVRDGTPATPEAVVAHERLLQKARERLERQLRDAATRCGCVTAIRATPGLGKTTTSAAVANQLHRAGKKVVIVVGSHAIAEQEWEPRLDDVYIWQPRTQLCTCHDREKLRALPELGYAQPKCQPGCPYGEQAELAAGHIVVYQYNHLFLYDGELLTNADVVIIDESPLSSFLPERSVDIADVERLLAYLDNECDAAATFVKALLKAVQGQDTLSGRELAERAREAVRGSLDTVLESATTSPVNVIRPAPRANAQVTKLPLQFFGELLKAFEHDLRHPNSLLHFAAGSFTWIERQTLLPALIGKPTAPAVIVLDGSADEQITAQLFRPWPVKVVTIDVPVSPFVQLIQCEKGTSTRKLVQTEAELRRATAKIAAVLNELGLSLDGGITYKQAIEMMGACFGGVWLYYGGQRGKNDLRDADTIAIIGSPTVPPKAIERQAMALWCDDLEPIIAEASKVASGYYVPEDSRLKALLDLKTREELRQAIHRIRPILAKRPITILVFSPWELQSLGFPVHQTIIELPHANGAEYKVALAVYQERTQVSGSASA